MTPYWAKRADRAARDGENARARRMAALDAALRDVLDLDRDVIDADGVAMLRHASAVVADLRRTW